MEPDVVPWPSGANSFRAKGPGCFNWLQGRGHGLVLGHKHWDKMVATCLGKGGDVGAISGAHSCLVTHGTHSLGCSGLIGVVGQELLGEVAGGARILEVFVQVLTSMMMVLIYSFLSSWEMELVHFACEGIDAHRTNVT